MSVAVDPSALILWLVLVRCRENRGLTQLQVAKLCKVSRTTVSKWEAGKGGVAESTLVKVAAGYKLFTPTGKPDVRALLLEGLAAPKKARRS